MNRTVAFRETSFHIRAKALSEIIHPCDPEKDSPAAAQEIGHRGPANLAEIL